MRGVVLALALASILTAAAYSSEKVTNYMDYANAISRNFAAGDTQTPYGWRGCEIAEASPKEVGVICEGTRALDVHGDHRPLDVNYYCEFQFQKARDAWTVSLALCQ